MATTKKLISHRAPDGGWGWVAVLGGFIYMMIVPSINRCFSLINTSWQHLFSASSQATSGAFSTYTVLCTVSGPLCSLLVARFGCQKVNMLGGIIITAGLLGSGFAPNLYVIYFTFGVLVGLGRGLVETGKEICFASWFNKNRAKATGFSAVAAGLGTMGLAPLIQICSDEFGTSGAMIILAGLAAHVVFAGMLMREPHTWEVKEDRAVQTGNLQEPSTVEHDEEAAIEIDLTEHREEDKLDVTFNSANSKTEEDKSKSSIWHLLRNSSFLAYCLMIGTGTGSFSLVNAHFAGFTVEQGISLMTSSYLISSTGVMLIVCRFVTGICLDVPWVRSWRKEIIGLIGFIMGAALTLMICIPGTMGFIVPWVMFILAQSVAGIQYGVVLSDIISKDDYIWALGVLRCCRGFGFLIGPLVGGLLKDVTGKYDMSFLFGGLLSVVPSTVYLATMFYHRRKAAARDNSTVSSEVIETQ